MRRFDYLRSERPPFFRRGLKNAPKHVLLLVATATLTAVVLAFGWSPQKPGETVPERARRVHGDRPLPSTATHARSFAAHRSLPRPPLRVTALHIPRARQRNPLPSVVPRGAIAAATSREEVVGVAVGGRAQAIVSLGDRTRIVTVGDVVFGRKIVTIGLYGVRFEDGSLRRVAIVQP